jgi:hypothetical protein
VMEEDHLEDLGIYGKTIRKQIGIGGYGLG